MCWKGNDKKNDSKVFGMYPIGRDNYSKFHESILFCTRAASSGGVLRKLQMADNGAGKFYTFFVDGQEYQTEQSELSGGEIMDMVNIPRSDGLVEILDDGTQQQINENDVIVFVGPGRRFKKAPRFRRG